MNLRIAFRHMDHSDSIEAYVKKELEEKVYKFLQHEDDQATIDVVLDAARIHHHHKVEIRLNSKHYHLIASNEGADLYEQIVIVVKLLVQEIKKQKERNLDKRNHPQLKKDKFEDGLLDDEEIAE